MSGCWASRDDIFRDGWLSVAERTRSCRARAGSRPRSQHGDLGILLGRAVAVLDQPADVAQAPQRPPRANEVAVDACAVAGGDVVEVLRVPEREGGEVE